MGENAHTPERNRLVVRAYREAFGTFDPQQYGPFLSDEPTYHAGMTKRVGQGAYHQNTGAGRVLYPHGALRSDTRREIADGDWVAQLVEREAITNKGEHYENLYGMFYELRDGLIVTQVELMDFRVSTEKFDLSALGPELRAGGEQSPPDALAPPPRRLADTGSSTERNKQLVIEFLDAFLGFDPSQYEHLLTDEPTHQVGMSRRTGREGFRDIAEHGRRLYPHGIAGRTLHALLGEGDDVAVLTSMRAVTNKGVDYENLYGMFFQLEDGRIASMTELLDNRVAATSFDLT
jgi:ketosteroid isomerase-like protein